MDVRHFNYDHNNSHEHFLSQMNKKNIILPSELLVLPRLLQVDIEVDVLAIITGLSQILVITSFTGTPTDTEIEI